MTPMDELKAVLSQKTIQISRLKPLVEAVEKMYEEEVKAHKATKGLNLQLAIKLGLKLSTKESKAQLKKMLGVK